MSERLLELARLADGSFVATFADDRPPAVVKGWADIRQLRARHRLNDHWTESDREAFIAEHGHPFDDWWNSLTPTLQQTLIADPRGPIPSTVAVELKRSLRHEPGRDGLRVEGSYFTEPVREYLTAKAAERH